jgi:hypothetical protein
LLDKIEASKVEAREIVDQARADARAAQQAAEAKLTEEIADLRRSKDAAREAEFNATVSAAEERLTSVRDGAAAKVDAMTQEVLSLFLPKGGN